MESDDDFQSFSPSKQLSPPLQLRKLKRLKKTINVKSADELISLPPVDFSKLQALETIVFEDSYDDDNGLKSGSEADPTETRRDLEFADVSPSEGFDIENVLKSVSDEDRTEPKRDLEFDDDKESKSGFDEDRTEIKHFDDDKDLKSGPDENHKEIKKASEFEDPNDVFDGKGMDRVGGMEKEIKDLKIEKSKKKRTSEGKLNGKKEKKKRVESGSDDAKVNPKASSFNKRREEKERKAHLQELHAESQRLLRETRDAAFKPIPVAQKPISSILEKIRQRKLEVSKKTLLLNYNADYNEYNGSVREAAMDYDSENISVEMVRVDNLTKVVQADTAACDVDKLSKVVHVDTVASDEDVGRGLDADHVDDVKESQTQSSHESVPSQVDLDEEPTPPFRVPVNDTQDLFDDSQTSDSKNELPNDQQNTPSEEVLTPSLLTMNLKFDSVPLDDSSSDEEDEDEIDKENVAPLPHRLEIGRSSPKGDPVKAFVDDEAEEEDDSDNDLFRFQENEEDDGYEDSEELNDLIATGYEEKPIDNDRRNELHQKWLEQQDAVGTDNLLERLQYGPKLRDTTMLDEEDDEEYEEEFYNNEVEDMVPAKLVRINSRKAKQMIAQMFPDKDDDFLSSDDEETEKSLVKQRLLNKAEERSTLLSPADDESSREVFGLIKKLNIVPDTKKKSKTSSYFDTLLTGGNSNSSSRSSFLGRASNHSLPSSRKQGSSTVKSFIFGRDDSNSRSSISMAEDISDTISREDPPARNFTAKFSNSQAKFSSRSTKIVSETSSGTSLFELLKRSSVQSNFCSQGNMVGLTQFAAFKLPKKPIKMEGRI